MPNTENTAVGKQHVVELYGCDKNIIDDMKHVEAIMIESAHRGNATVVAHAFHKFSPQGVSGAVVLAESHIAMHSWPEYNYCAVDIFTCGDQANNDVILKYLKESFRATSYHVVELERKALPTPIQKTSSSEKISHQSI